MEGNEKRMAPTVLLCAEAESLANPRLLGIEDAHLEGCPWLATTSSAAEARTIVAASPDIKEVWIASSDEMTALNLAAAIRKDRAGVALMLIAFSPTGSFLSNASAVGADDVLTEASFPKRFYEASCSQGPSGRTSDAIIPAVIDGEAGSVRLVFDGKPQAASVDEAATRQISCGGDAAAVPLCDDSGVPEAVAEAPAPAAEQQTDGAEPERSCAIPAPADTVSSVTSVPSSPDSRGLLIPIVSGSGGAGRTTMAAVIAMLLAGEGLSVLALDLDLQFGDLHRFLGCDKPLSVDEAIADAASVRALRQGAAAGASLAGRPAVISAPPRPEQAELILGQVGPLLDACMPLFDAIVVDTGTAWGEQHALLLERATNPVFLMDQRVSSIFACKRALGLCARMGIATRSFAFVLNRCSRNAPFAGIDVAMALQGAHVLELRDGGREVEELLGAGMAGELCYTKNEMVRSMRLALDEMAILGSDGRVGQEAIKESRTRRSGRARFARKERTAGEVKGGSLELLGEGFGLGSHAASPMGAGA